jgi:hypothetical protein
MRIKPHRLATTAFIDIPIFFLLIIVPRLFRTTTTFKPQTQPVMGTGKKEAQRKVRQGKEGDGMANVKVKGENFYR